MKGREVEGLRAFLDNFNPEDLIFLEDNREPWFPLLGNLDPNNVHNAICNAVLCEPPGVERLRRISWIRCRMVPLKYRRTWRLCLMTEMYSLEDSTALLKHIASSVKVLNVNFAEPPLEWIAQERTIYACFIINGGPSLPQSSLYVVMWSTHPIMAMHCTTKASEKRVYAAFLAAVSGGIKLFMKVILYSLEEGIDWALRTWGLTSSPGGDPFATPQQQPYLGSTAGLLNAPRYALPSGTAGTKQQVATQRGDILHEDSRQDSSSEQAPNEHWSGVRAQNVKVQHFCPTGPFCSSSEPLGDLHFKHEQEWRTIRTALTLQLAHERAARQVMEFRPLHICDPCGKSFEESSTYLDHLEECPGVQAFNCPNCMLPFRSETSLRMHLQNDTVT